MRGWVAGKSEGGACAGISGEVAAGGGSAGGGGGAGVAGWGVHPDGGKAGGESEPVNAIGKLWAGGSGIVGIG